MAIQWKDVTSYSRGDEKRTPRSFEATVSGILLEVTKHLDYPDGEWVLSAGDLIGKKLTPVGMPAEHAQQLCIRLATKRLEEILAAIRS